jgi:hypothetical protein
MRRTPSRSALALLTAGALAMSGAVLAQEQEQPPQEQSAPEPEPEQLIPRQDQGLPPGQIPAALKAREANFVYRSSARQLSCDELRRRIALILSALGARQDIDVRAHECDTFIDPMDRAGRDRMNRQDSTDPLDRSSSSPLERMRAPSATSFNDRSRAQSTPVRIRAMMPVELTSDIMDEVEKDKARRELVSRVTGNPNAAMNDAIFFPAELRQVELSHDTLDLDPMDCELMEQMASSVFRKFDIKVKSRSLSCDPRERSSINPSLTVEALMPVGFQLPEKKKKFEGSISIP